MDEKDPQDDVLHFENPSQLTPEEIIKAIKHHQRHHKVNAGAEQQASSQQEKDKTGS